MEITSAACGVNAASADRCILGISGAAIAFYLPSVPVHVCVEDVPLAAGVIDAAGLADRIREMRPDAAIIEHVAATRVGLVMTKGGLVMTMPGQGVSSFGVVCRALAMLAIPCHCVSPSVWRKDLEFPVDEDAARALARCLFPATAEHFSRKKDHGRATAAMLAWYGAAVQGLLGEVAQ
jgi:crossover junction endodeoxyribonuclease RuvC